MTEFAAHIDDMKQALADDDRDSILDLLDLDAQPDWDAAPDAIWEEWDAIALRAAAEWMGS